MQIYQKQSSAMPQEQTAFNQKVLLSNTTGAKVMPNNCKNDFEFYMKHYFWYNSEKGDVYTWGSGEMG